MQETQSLIVVLMPASRMHAFVKGKERLAKQMVLLLQDLEVEKKASALSQAQQQASKANIALQEGEAQKAAREEEMAKLTGTVSRGYSHLFTSWMQLRHAYRCTIIVEFSSISSLQMLA